MIEHESEATLSREDAAARLRELADMLSRQNAVTFDLDGLKTTMKVPGEVTWSIEIEATDDGGEIEVEISW